MRWMWIVAVVGCGRGVGSSVETADTGFDLGTETVDGWPEAWEVLEQEVLGLVNLQRRVFADCGSEGGFGPAARLTYNDQLRDAARKHSRNMSRRGFFSHRAPNGSTPGERAVEAGYPTNQVGENIAAGQPTPEAVMAAWMSSDGHCANIMDSGYVSLGVGLYIGSDGAPYWTQVFGSVP